MRVFLVMSLWLICLSLLSSTAIGAGWQDLLDQADSLVAVGDLGSADGVVDEAIRKALTEYGASDTTVKVRVYWEGSRESRYFRTYAEAETLYARVLKIKEKTLGADHNEVADVIDVIAWIYNNQDRLAEAEPLYGRVLAIREKLYGTDHADVAQTLHNLGLLYSRQDRFAEAESTYKRALSIRERVLAPEHLDLGWTLNNLASVYKSMGRYGEAELLHRRALAIWEKVLGPVSPNVANSLLGLFDIYYRQGKYAEAEAFCRRAVAIAEQALGPEHPDVANSLSNLAALYSEQGKYAEAEPLHRRALAIWEKAEGPEHLDVAYGLHNLATLCLTQGKYAEAEPLLKRALAIKQKVRGPDHTDMAYSLGNLASLYAWQGRYTEAEPLFKRTLAIWEGALGPEHTLVTHVLQNLAGFYAGLGKYAEAEQFSGRALAIREKTLGPDAVDVAYSLSDLASIYRDQGRHAEAEPLYTRALAIAEESLGPEHTLVARCLRGQAEVLADQGRYAEAEPLYTRAVAIEVKALGDEHPDVAGTLEAMCHLCRLQDRDSEAEELAGRACGIRHRNFTDNATVLSENDALMYSQFLRNSVSNYLTCYSDFGPKARPLAEKACDIVFSSKGQVSDGMLERQRRLVEETDSTTLTLAEALRLAKFQLSRLFVEGPGDDLEAYRSTVDSLTKEANDSEAALSRHSASFTKRQDYKNVSAARVVSLLPEGSALVEYVKYDYRRLRPEEKIPHYLAIAVSPNQEPLISDLGQASEIDGLVDEYRAHMLRLSDTERHPVITDRAEYDAISKRLYERLWEPIAGYMSNKGLVFVALDGALNMVSFAGLVDSEGTYLVEHFPIHHLSSGRDLIRLNEEEKLGSGLFALGDPDYDTLVSGQISGVAGSQYAMVELGRYATRSVRSGCGHLRDVTVDPLPATRRELELTKAGWQRSSDEPVVVYFGADATEDRFKAEAPGRRVIHLATHGYFLEGACQPEQPETGLSQDIGFVGENPLLLSGLFFAGANLHGGADSLGADDGVLTAYEVSAMDLSGTEMVVLSACETGLGKVEEGEGVYGLRRAFQMAGARTVVSALWPVSDEATADMMSQLYERQDESIPETMRRIQMEKISELRQSGRPDHPYTWASFIAMGDWR